MANVKVAVFFKKIGSAFDEVDVGPMPVFRSVDDANKITNSMKALIEGPDAVERKFGFKKAATNGFTVATVTVHQGVCAVKFNVPDGFSISPNDAELLGMLVDSTTSQFDIVQSTEVTLDGTPLEDFWGGEE